jgi:hypothetical protein
MVGAVDAVYAVIPSAAHVIAMLDALEQDRQFRKNWPAPISWTLSRMRPLRLLKRTTFRPRPRGLADGGNEPDLRAARAASIRATSRAAQAYNPLRQITASCVRILGNA